MYLVIVRSTVPSTMAFVMLCVWRCQDIRRPRRIYAMKTIIMADGCSYDIDWENTSSEIAVWGKFNQSPDGDACDEAWSLSEYGRLYNWYAVDESFSVPELARPFK